MKRPGCFGSATSSCLSRVPPVPHETVQDSVVNPDGWSCDCEDAPIVATDGGEAVLIAVISAYEEGSTRMSELSVGAAEFVIMRRACLLHLADHCDVDAIRHDVDSIVVTGERQARLCHLIGAWQWAEGKE